MECTNCDSIEVTYVCIRCDRLWCHECMELSEPPIEQDEGSEYDDELYRVETCPACDD
jgi:hypothetical protein